MDKHFVNFTEILQGRFPNFAQLAKQIANAMMTRSDKESYRWEVRTLTNHCKTNAQSFNQVARGNEEENALILCREKPTFYLCSFSSIILSIDSFSEDIESICFTSTVVHQVVWLTCLPMLEHPLGSQGTLEKPCSGCTSQWVSVTQRSSLPTSKVSTKIKTNIDGTINTNWFFRSLWGKIRTLIVATLAKIAKSAIDSSSPANHSDFSRKDSNVLSRTLTASRRSREIFFTPDRNTGR